MSSKIVVVDYDAGNLYNVANALTRLGANFRFSSRAEDIAAADGVILPGVGAAPPAMNSLGEQGLIAALRDLQAPFLGICLGMQLLFERSEEEDCPCLGRLPGIVRRLDSEGVKVPHIGWNDIRFTNGGSNGSRLLLEGIPEGTFFYFVHSYAAEAGPSAIALTDYPDPFASVVCERNIAGVQFHPERSGEAGLRLLGNFVDWVGARCS